MLKSRWRTPSKLAQKRRKRALVHVGESALMLLAFIGLLSIGAHQPEVTISNIVISGNSVITENELQAFVTEKLSGSYFELFPKNNIIIYPKTDTEAAVLNAFPRIQAVEINFLDFQSIQLSVIERNPFALWCGFEAHKNNGSNCYFLDENGLVFAHAPDFTGNTFFRFYGALSEAEPIGSRFLTAEVFRTVGFFIKEITDRTLDPVEFSINTAGDTTLVLESETKIIFTIENDFSVILENLDSALSSDEIANINNLDYIDLRFGNKVFYKFK